MVAISADGSHVYYVARSVLTTTANAQGRMAEEGANNLYVYEREAGEPQGRIAFIAQLPDVDREAQWASNDQAGSANVTPEGRFLVFESHGDLTSDDTRTDGAIEIFRYDAQSGELVRISSGERGFDDDGNTGVGDAHIAQAIVGAVHAGASRGDPTMSNNGRYIFFESPIGLTPHALNDVQIGTIKNGPVYAENVYEWEGGQVYLISDGRDTAALASGSAVELLGSDGTGANVFFRTAAQLAPQDTDTQADYYDARICEPGRGDPCVFQPAPPSPPCLGEECHGTPVGVPPVVNAPTATFNGEGNVGGLSGIVVRAKTAKKKVIECRKSMRRSRSGCLKPRTDSKRRKADGKKRKTRPRRGGK